MAVDPTYQTLNYEKQGGAEWDIGGVLNILPGGALQFNGSPINVRAGQATTVTAADTIVTGLTTVAAVIVSLDSDPTDNPEWASATIGDQAGSPAAGSFILKTWQNTGGTDPTPAAASTFGKKVNWVAFGT